MMFILITLQIAYGENIEELQQRIESLQAANNFLHNQLLSCSLALPTAIVEDLHYNKEKLQNLILEYYESSEKLYIAEEIKYYLHAISEDLKTLGTDSESISYENLEVAVSELNASILKAKVLRQDSEFAKAYNKLRLQFDECSENQLGLVRENAEFLAKYEATHAELKNLYTLYHGLNDSNKLLVAELSLIKSQHEDRIEMIENSLTSEQQISRSAEILNFKLIQESQNSLIASLQQLNNDETLVIEQQKTDISTLENKILVQESTITSLVKYI